MVKSIDKGLGVMGFLEDYLTSGFLFFQANTVFRPLPMYLNIKTTSWGKKLSLIYVVSSLQQNL